jgi:hypothetical protein
VTGWPNYNSTIYTRIGDTQNAVRFKDGKPVEVSQNVIVPGKTLTVTAEGVNANGQQYHYVWVFDRQLRQEDNIMKTTIFALAFFSLTLPAFGQEVFKPEGTYQLNLAKSAIHGPIVKSMTTNVGDTVTVLSFDANGKPYTAIFPFIADGKPHPIMGSPTYDT